MPGVPSFTAIIPVRAGSKGVPGKNLWEHRGISLLARAIRLGFHLSPWVERVIVSTDSPAMRQVAIEEGAECRHLRPEALASDTATSIDVVSHVLEHEDVASSHILLLQATSPLRTLEDGRSFITAYLAAGCDAATSVVKIEEPRPEKLKRLEAGKVRPYLGQTYEGPRQALPQPYALNGAFYAIATNVFRDLRTFLPPATLGYPMPENRSHNLDSQQDLLILSAMLQAGHWQMEDLPRRSAAQPAIR